ncbi:hypothetical protein I3760_05G252700 [Carya illinoinensis]|nr:hypothetical protein I3760_05G252700 [Carya illinoinensis]
MIALNSAALLLPAPRFTEKAKIKFPASFRRSPPAPEFPGLLLPSMLSLKLPCKGFIHLTTCTHFYFTGTISIFKFSSISMSLHDTFWNFAALFIKLATQNLIACHISYVDLALSPARTLHLLNHSLHVTMEGITPQLTPTWDDRDTRLNHKDILSFHVDPLRKGKPKR